MQLDLTEIGSRTGKTIEEVRYLITQAKESMIPRGKQVSVVENGQTRFFIVTRQGV